MRLSTTQIFQQGVDAILDRQTRVQRTQMELSTGKRILSPADDPTGSAQTLALTETLTATQQYQRNADVAEGRIGLQEGSLTGAMGVLQRARELAVQGLNGAMSSTDRTAIAAEIRQLVDEMVGIANTKDANGEYIFAGFQMTTATPPFTHNGAGTFTYQGDQGQRLLQIGPTRQVAVGDSGMDVFMKVRDAAGTGYQDVFTTLYGLATDLEADAPNGASLDAIDNALNKFGEVRARHGARLNAIDNQREINDSLRLQLEETRSKVNDLDYAQAASDLSRFMLTLEAAQQAFVRVQGLSLFNFLR